MRRYLSLLAIALFVVSAASIVADEAVLIDFTNLKADIVPQKDPATDKDVMTQNRATMMDFSTLAGASYTADQKKAMRTSLALANWDVVLASSSRTTANTRLSMTAAVPVKGTDGKETGTVLGVRIHFPVESFNSWARVSPPFEIPAFEPKATIGDDGAITKKEASTSDDAVNARMSRFEGSYDANARIYNALGVVKNVGIIKTVAVTVKGLNFPHGLSVVLKDNDNVEKTMFMGYLNFDGWKTLKWDNPAYITEVRNRELRLYPLYPRATPFIKFDSFLLTRDADHEGGDFVTYIQNVKLLYDKAVLEPVMDIDDESVWGIIQTREDQRKKAEAGRFGNRQVLRYLETLKKENKTSFTTEVDTTK